MASQKAFESIRDRIASAARIVKTVNNESQRSKMIGKQADLIVGAVTKISLRASDVAELSEMVTAARFGEEVETMILDAILAAPDADEEDGSKHQDYTSLCNYLTQSVWNDCGQDPDALNDHVIGLGLRDPSEPTIQMMIYVCSYQQNGRRELQTMSVDVGHAAFLAMKRSFLGRVKHAEPLLEPPCKKLPEMPETFCEARPMTYQSAFGEDVPIENIIPYADRFLVKRFPQRMGRKARESMKSQINVLELQRLRQELHHRDAKRRAVDDDCELKYFGRWSGSPEHSRGEMMQRRPSPLTRMQNALSNPRPLNFRSSPSGSGAPRIALTWKDDEEGEAEEEEPLGDRIRHELRTGVRRKRTDEDVQKDLEEIENQEDAANKEEQQQQHLSQAMAPWRRRPTSSWSTEGHKGNVQTTSTAGHKAEAPVSATSELQGAGRKSVIEMVNAIEGAYARKKDEKDKAKEAEKERKRVEREAEKEKKKLEKAKEAEAEAAKDAASGKAKRLRKKTTPSAEGAAPPRVVAAASAKKEPKKVAAVAATPTISGYLDMDTDSNDNTDSGLDEDARKVLPKLDHEKSRSQVLVRTGFTGLGRGQSLQLKYKCQKTKEDAFKKGRLLCRKMCRQRGVADADMPNKFKEIIWD